MACRVLSGGVLERRTRLCLRAVVEGNGESSPVEAFYGSSRPVSRIAWRRRELCEPADRLCGHAAAAVGPAVEPHRRVVTVCLVILCGITGWVSTGSSACRLRLCYQPRPRQERLVDDEPFTNHSSQSMYPWLSSFTCNASMTRAKTSLLRQRRKWSYTVCRGGQIVRGSRATARPWKGSNRCR